MAVTVKMFSTLADRSRSGRHEFQVDWREGLTPGEILRSEGFVGADAESIISLINDVQAKHSDVLKDGDRLELMVSIQGG